MKRRAIAFLVATIAVSMLMVACSGSKASGPKLREELAYSDFESALLASADLSAELAHLQADPGNPTRETEETVVEDSFDVDEDRRDLEEFGWEGEWTTKFAVSADAAEVFYAASTIALYETPDGASGELQDQLKEAVDFAGRTDANGVTLVEVRDFGVDGLGVEALGFNYTLGAQTESGDVEYYATLVAFRVDRLIGVAVLGSLEQPDMRALAIDLAAVLDGKIQSTLVEP
jgi:hypothetical protein